MNVPALVLLIIGSCAWEMFEDAVTVNATMLISLHVIRPSCLGIAFPKPD